MNIGPEEFEERLKSIEVYRGLVSYVTGPGRSGAVAGVYASHYLNKPYIPIGNVKENHKPILIIDTAIQTGKTLRRARNKIGKGAYACALFNEPPSLKFWYEKVPPCHKAREPVTPPPAYRQVLRMVLLPLLWVGERIWNL